MSEHQQTTGNSPSQAEQDCLSRNTFVEELLPRILAQNSTSEVHEACGTIVLDGPYGTGKTFIMTWLKELIEQNHREVNVVYFDAWKHEDAPDPMIPILAAMAKNPHYNLFKLKKLALSILPQQIRDPIQEIDNLLKREDDIEGFQRELDKAIRRNDDGTPSLVVLIDELDRCRPDFALSLLERVKHLFSVQGVVFLLAMDMETMRGMVRKIYGTCDDLGYLLKLFDLRVSLPMPNRQDFLQHLRSKLPIDDFVADQTMSRFAFFAEIFEFSLRQMMRGYLELADARMENLGQFYLMQAAALIVALRIHDPKSLHKICSSDCSAGAKLFINSVIDAINTPQKHFIAQEHGRYNILSHDLTLFGISGKVESFASECQRLAAHIDPVSQDNLLNYYNELNSLQNTLTCSGISLPDGISVIQYVNKLLDCDN